MIDDDNKFNFNNLNNLAKTLQSLNEASCKKVDYLKNQAINMKRHSTFSVPKEILENTIQKQIINNLNNQYDILVSQLKTANKQVEILQNQLSEERNQTNQNVSIINSLQDSNEELKKQTLQLQNQLDASVKQTEQNESIIKSVQDSYNELGQHTEQNQKLIKSLQDSCKDLKLQNSILQEQLDTQTEITTTYKKDIESNKKFTYISIGIAFSSLIISIILHFI